MADPGVYGAEKVFKLLLRNIFERQNRATPIAHRVCREISARRRRFSAINGFGYCFPRRCSVF